MGALRQVFTSRRVWTALEVLAIAFLIVYLIGVVGYSIAYDQTLPQSAYSAAIAMSGTGGRAVEAETDGERVWNGFYSLSTNIFLVALVGGVVGVVLAEYLQVVEQSWSNACVV